MWEKIKRFITQGTTYRKVGEMTPKERSDEKKQLIIRVNELCAADKAPPQYYMVSQLELSKLNKIINPDHPTH